MAIMTSRVATRGLPRPKLSSCSSYYNRQLNPTRKKRVIMGSSFLNNPYFLLSSGIARLQKFVPIQPSNSQRRGGGGGGGGGGEEEETSSMNDTTSVVSQEDWNLLLKLGAGSLAGAAVIKYGSILFPEITRPNILQALIMISTPVVVAIVLLIKQSRQE